MDCYEVLGLEKTATQKEVKTAYYKLASKYHPDVNDASNASAFFRLINEAYETLYDPDRRLTYDNSQNIGQTPPFEEEPPSYQQEYQDDHTGYEQVEVRAVKRIGLMLLLLPFKAIAAVFLLFSKFLEKVAYILASIANLAGGLLMLLGVIMGIVFVFQFGFTLQLLACVAIAFIGFLITLIGGAMPAVFEFLSEKLLSFIRYVPVKYLPYC